MIFYTAHDLFEFLDLADVLENDLCLEDDAERFHYFAITIFQFLIYSLVSGWTQYRLYNLFASRLDQCKSTQHKKHNTQVDSRRVLHT